MSGLRRGSRVLVPALAFALLGTVSAEAQRGPASCRAELGPERAERLARQCREVSLASRPPCHSRNSCRIITDEIRRGCTLLEDDAPSFCGRYTDGDDEDEE